MVEIIYICGNTSKACVHGDIIILFDSCIIFLIEMGLAYQIRLAPFYECSAGI